MLSQSTATTSETAELGGHLCSRYCLRKRRKEIATAKKATSTKKKRVLWKDDGSLRVLMDWMCTEGNYKSYCGGSSSGRTKESYHKFLEELISNTSGCTHRSAKDIASKILSLESQFRHATDFIRGTYYALEPIMGERPNATPLFTNELRQNTMSNLLGKGQRVAIIGPDDMSESESDVIVTEKSNESLLKDSSEAIPVNDEETPKTNESATASKNPARRRLSLTPMKESIGRESNKRFKGSRSTSIFSEKNEDAVIALKQSESKAKQEVDAATKAKINAEKAYVDVKTQREIQQLKFERMKQKKELKDLGYTSDQIESEFNC